MLGSKLVKKADFDTDFETQTLELLKLRFLESELHHCDVMLKDMQVWLYRCMLQGLLLLLQRPVVLVQT